MATLSGFSSTVVAIVALISLVLTILTWTAYRRTGHPKVRYIALAFLVHTTKSSIVAYGLATGTIGHDILEVVEACFDFTMVVLLFLPFWSRE